MNADKYQNVCYFVSTPCNSIHPPKEVNVLSKCWVIMFLLVDWLTDKNKKTTILHWEILPENIEDSRT